VKEKTSLVILECFSSQKTAATRAHLGRLKVKLQVLGYDEIDIVKSRVEKTVMLDYPPSEFDTVGLWWDIPADVMQKLNNLAYDALVVLRRVVLSLLPSMTMSDPTDTAGLEVLIHEQTQLPQIFIFDAYPGGIGISEQVIIWYSSFFILSLVCPYVVFLAFSADDDNGQTNLPGSKDCSETPL
jgi:DEAD/DEAH box helicase domain-containing protein